MLITDFIKFPARVNGKIAYKTQEDLIKDFDNKNIEEDDLNTKEIENELRKLGYV